ncbi:MAG: HAD hydrolase-like protein [Pseudomonadota bacterium]|jgi:phosphoglycolate phosphatase
MPHYKLAIFDLDGTLSDSLPWFKRVVNSVADKHRFKRIEDHEGEMLRGKTSREIMAHLKVPFWRLPWIARDMRRMKAADLHEIPLFPGVHRMLGELAASGITIAMVSSDSEANTRACLAESARHVSCFDCGASLFGKASHFRNVLKRTGITASHAICIGDEIRDGEAARKAGIDFGAVSWGFAQREALAALSPALIFDHVEDIAKQLRTHETLSGQQKPAVGRVSAA